MKHLKISHQLVLLISGLMLAFGLATFFKIDSASKAVYSERYEMLRVQTETAISVMARYHALELKGEITRDEAQKAAYAVISDMRYVPDGYYFGYDYSATRLIYPDQKGVGQNFAHIADKDGNKFLVEIIDKARQGGGWTEYDWAKPGQSADLLYPKAAYSLAFEPWQITVGTGTYLDDLDASIANSMRGALITGMLIFLVGTAVAFLVIRGITKPLTAIHGALKAVADGTYRRSFHTPIWAMRSA
jgi:methyl-accepting chemotaxis protein